MGERKFVITKWDAPINPRLDAEVISESELKRRLSAILVDVPPSDIMDSWIDILLHGEGKEVA